MLLPATAPDEARVIAERVRTSIAGGWIDPVGQITISIGIASWQPTHSQDESGERRSVVIRKRWPARFRAINRAASAADWSG